VYEVTPASSAFSMTARWSALRGAVYNAGMERAFLTAAVIPPSW